MPRIVHIAIKVDDLENGPDPPRGIDGPRLGAEAPPQRQRARWMTTRRTARGPA
jgi:hypothetical protein